MPDDPHDEWHHDGPTDAPDPYHVVRQWERLRLAYNAVLVPWTMFLIAALPGGGTGNPADVFVGAVLANVCFCLGPVAEMYLVRLGANARAARRWLFALGTAFTALAALLSLRL
jgi:hypothetical protein